MNSFSVQDINTVKARWDFPKLYRGRFSCLPYITPFFSSADYSACRCGLFPYLPGRDIL